MWTTVTVNVGRCEVTARRLWGQCAFDTLVGLRTGAEAAVRIIKATEGREAAEDGTSDAS
jgi:hypothetical protein